ncbi:MAG TPA: hypothetical protein DCY86_07335 [Bdellovibrionales bacterium]|nr:hypothetical protein [Bdellovibrionales bacterium]
MAGYLNSIHQECPAPLVCHRCGNEGHRSRQ